MADRDLPRLPVVVDGRLVGTVADADVCRAALAGELPARPTTAPPAATDVPADVPTTAVPATSPAALRGRAAAARAGAPAPVPVPPPTAGEHLAAARAAAERLAAARRAAAQGVRDA
jgi:CBS domain-containing protein